MIATGLSPDGVRSVTCAVCCARTIDVTARSAMSVKTRLRFMSRETAAHYRMRVVGSRAMRRTVVFLAVLLATSCGKESTQRPTFATPTIPIAHLTLQNIPPNADVIVPGAIIKLDGSVAVEDPKALKVRSTEKAASTPAVVAGVAVPVTQVPINAMVDRHDYLVPPSSAPVVMVK